MDVDEALRVLGMAASATPTEIKVTYRRLVRTWHPDRHGADPQRRAVAEEALKRIIDAYRTLQRAGLSASKDPRPGAGTTSYTIQTEAPVLFGRSQQLRADREKAETAQRRRRELTRRWLPPIVVAGLLWITSGWWLPAVPHVLPERLFGYSSWGDIVLRRVPDYVARQATLADLAACFSSNDEAYYDCLLTRRYEREAGYLVYTLPPTPSAPLMCDRLQRWFSQARYGECVSQLRQVQRR